MAEGRIFISYRRGVDNGEARSLYYQLERFFDRDHLFMDVDDVPVGIDFVDHLDAQVAACNALIAVIGRGWIRAVERLHNEEDFVRIEIEAALKRGNQIPVIPLLIDDNKLPVKSQLPECLQKLVRRSGVPIRHESYPGTIGSKLVPALRNALGLIGEAPAPRVLKAAEAAAPYIETTEPEAPAPPAFGTIFRDIDEPWCPEMVVIPAGTFMMGSTEAETTKFGVPDEYAAWEKPRHEVEITQPIALARYATTFDEYDAFCEATDREKAKDEGWGRGRRPVIRVSWNDAVAYCDWLSSKTGYLYRLPSEAEWEYACRAGTETAFNFGDLISTDLANYDGTETAGGSKKGEYRKKTLPADYPGFKSNAFRLSQMHGNVWEWCADQFANSYESARRQSPWLSGPEESGRVLRGGSWGDDPQFLRSANRFRDGPVVRNYDVGFRPARMLLTP
ncbi:MAG: SUMF1/EgtB/PvdO family nonheme iron enzyme [Pseudomonadota bacterium]